MKKWISNTATWFQKVACPVRKEFVFFVLAYLMLIQQTIEWLFVAHESTFNQIYYCIQGLIIEIGVVYVATAIVYYTHRKWVKWLFYLFFWLLMSITLFLVLNFDMSISQQTIAVAVETNPKESSEFVNTYFWGANSLISYGIDLVVLVLIFLAEWKRNAIKRVVG